MPPAPLHAVILAAGSGRRMGFPKALLELKGRWMLPRIASALHEGGADAVHVVAQPEIAAAIEERGGCAPARVVPHEEAERGRTGTIQRGLRELPGEAAVLIHPCDVPLLSPQAVRAVVTTWCRHPRRGNMVARPVTPAGRGGHPLLVGRWRIADLKRFAPDRPLRDLVHADPAQELRVPWHGDPGPFLDVDTPEQLALIESLLDPRGDD